jgi:hypothetical protein
MIHKDLVIMDGLRLLPRHQHQLQRLSHNHRPSRNSLLKELPASPLRRSLRSPRRRRLTLGLPEVLRLQLNNLLQLLLL